MFEVLQDVKQEDCVPGVGIGFKKPFDRSPDDLVVQVPTGITVSGKPLDAHQTRSPGLYAAVESLAYDRAEEAHPYS